MTFDFGESHSLETRMVMTNGRVDDPGPSREALRELLRQSGGYVDPGCWAILDAEWQAKVIWGGGKTVFH